MVTSRRLALAVVAATACGGATPRATSPSATASNDVTLYRGAALVHQRVTLELGPSPTRTSVAVARGVPITRISVVDRGDTAIASLREPASGVLEITASATRPGRHTIAIAYVTDLLRWDAAYALTTTSARSSAQLRGALSIRNLTGMPLPRATIRVVDGELTAASSQPSRTLGPVDVRDGETRLELVPDTVAAQPMRSVLVYDPIGTRLDQRTPTPSHDPSLGLQPPPSSRVTESFEIARDPTATAGLPGGPGRLLERHADGTLALLGEARMFDATTRDATVDTIAIGTAADITATRERRELTIDDDGGRIVEEFAIAIDNQRALPARVLILEHLYRGVEWTIAYPVEPVAEKVGLQQIALRATVPAHAKAKQLYVVVYTWNQ